MPATTPTPPQKAARIIPVPTLRFTGGQVSGLAIRLTEDDGTLGRRDDNDYVVPDPQVSRVHARLEKRVGSILLTDLGSSGGTEVNGEQLTGPHAVSHGDVIRFGGIEARFEDPASAASDEDATMVFELPEVETGPSLSPRQQQVLEGISHGQTNKEIGADLGITERTVKAYAQEVYEKLGVRNRAEAVAEGVRHGLL